MKNRIVILILAGLMAISLMGCKDETQNKSTADQKTGTEAVESVASGTEESDDTTSASKEPETEDTVKMVSQDETEQTAEKEKKADSEPVSEIQNSGQTSGETKQTVQTETPVVSQQQSENKTVNEQAAESMQTPASTETQTSVEAVKDEKNKGTTDTVKAGENEKEAATPKVEETPASEPNATAADTKAIADKVLYYINSYRSTPAAKLTGLTGYAEYRSGQLIGNFAHDTADKRAAATALAYGTYIDPTLYGIEGTPYYTVNASEAIAKAGYTGTVDDVAESLANLVKNSQSHWKYVGDSTYEYIGVGITYDSGMWYCCIAVAAENTDNN